MIQFTVQDLKELNAGVERSARTGRNPRTNEETIDSLSSGGD